MTIATPRRDITDRADIAGLVADFYTRAFDDELLGPVFVDVARLDLTRHLPVMCDFWETVLFRAGQYRRNVLHPHLALHSRAALTPAHFARWLTLWTATVDLRFAGDRAEFAKVQATRIAGSMSRRIVGPSAKASCCEGSAAKGNPRVRPHGRRRAGLKPTAESDVSSPEPNRARPVPG